MELYLTLLKARLREECSTSLPLLDVTLEVLPDTILAGKEIKGIIYFKGRSKIDVIFTWYYGINVKSM